MEITIAQQITINEIQRYQNLAAEFQRTVEALKAEKQTAWVRRQLQSAQEAVEAYEGLIQALKNR